MFPFKPIKSLDNYPFRDNVEREYARAREIEKKHSKVDWVNIYNAQELLGMLGVRNQVRFWFIKEGASYYSHIKGKNKKGDIILSSFHTFNARSTSKTIIHELGHMVVNVEGLSARDDISFQHGKDYLWVLETLYAAAKELKNQSSPF